MNLFGPKILTHAREIQDKGTLPRKYMTDV